MINNYDLWNESDACMQFGSSKGGQTNTWLGREAGLFLCFHPGSRDHVDRSAIHFPDSTAGNTTIASDPYPVHPCGGYDDGGSYGVRSKGDFSINYLEGITWMGIINTCMEYGVRSVEYSVLRTPFHTSYIGFI